MCIGRKTMDLTRRVIYTQREHSTPSTTPRRDAPRMTIAQPEETRLDRSVFLVGGRNVGDELLRRRPRGAVRRSRRDGHRTGRRRRVARLRAQLDERVGLSRRARRPRRRCGDDHERDCGRCAYRARPGCRSGSRRLRQTHAKTFVVDRARVFVGSFNFDPRSARLNTELGFVIESRTMAQAIAEALSIGFRTARTACCWGRTRRFTGSRSSTAANAHSIESPAPGSGFALVCLCSRCCPSSGSCEVFYHHSVILSPRRRICCVQRPARCDCASTHMRAKSRSMSAARENAARITSRELPVARVSSVEAVPPCASAGVTTRMTPGG